ncbi:putative nuclease HARBI1 [Exaiptasia diaphana]|nr:putative nuclease HARBI1 [Exaiptasia diaphana]
MPEIGFNVDGIQKHIQSFFNEQRRYKKSKACNCNSSPKLPELPQSDHENDSGSLPKKKMKSSVIESDDSDSGSPPQKGMKSTLIREKPTSDDEMSFSQSTPSTLSVDNSDDDEEIECSQAVDFSSNQAKAQVAYDSFNIKACQLIIKAVFGGQLTRDSLVKVLKNKFLVKSESLTSLTMLENSYFREQLRLNADTFEELLNILRPSLTRKSTFLRDCIPPEKVLALGLYQLAHGNSYSTIAATFNVGKTTVIEATQDVVEALCEIVENYIRFPTTEDEVIEARETFESLTDIPNAVGAIDGTHIRIQNPKDSGPDILVDTNNRISSTYFPAFDITEEAGAKGPRWKKYVARLKNPMTAMNITNAARQRALLLHYVGEDTNEIFDTLPNTEATVEENPLKKGIDALTLYFEDKKNIVFEEYQFRKTKQEYEELIMAYCTRLNRAQNNGRSTDNDRPKFAFVQSNSILAAHLDRSRL